MAQKVKGRFVLRDQLKRISGDIDNLVVNEVRNSQIKLAPKLVYDIAQRRKFNSYSGAMAYAYGASLVADGVHYANYQLEDGALGSVRPPSQTITKNSKGRTIAYLQKPRRHTNTPLNRKYVHILKRKHIRGRKTQTNLYPTYRYIKKFERLGKGIGGGFHDTPMQIFRGKRPRSRVGNMNAQKRRSGSRMDRLFYIQIYNASTYSAMVQAKGYDVISGGRITGRAKYLRGVIKDVVKDDINRAMHNYCKDYSRMHRRSNDIAYGSRFYRESDTFD